MRVFQSIFFYLNGVRRIWLIISIPFKDESTKWKLHLLWTLFVLKRKGCTDIHPNLAILSRCKSIVWDCEYCTEHCSDYCLRPNMNALTFFFFIFSLVYYFSFSCNFEIFKPQNCHHPSARLTTSASMPFWRSQAVSSASSWSSRTVTTAARMATRSPGHGRSKTWHSTRRRSPIGVLRTPWENSCCSCQPTALVVDRILMNCGRDRTHSFSRIAEVSFVGTRTNVPTVDHLSAVKWIFGSISIYGWTLLSSGMRWSIEKAVNESLYFSI